MDKMEAANQSVMCPWTSSAPLQSVTRIRLQDMNNMDGRNKENEKGAPQEADNNEAATKSNDVTVNNASTHQFYHFLRLMQLFPNVHPATLHSVMSLCKNDFFVAVDKLLYAKRCKELYNRRTLLQNIANKKRFSPYNCAAFNSQNVSVAKPQIITLDGKKIVLKSRNVGKLQVNDETHSSTSDLQTVQLNCDAPMQPLSPPMNAQDLSAANNNN